MTAPLVLLFFLAGPAKAPPAAWSALLEPSPSELSHDDYFLATFVNEVRTAQFDPAEWWYLPPICLHFNSKSHFLRELGGPPEPCSMTAVRRLQAYDIHASCGTGVHDGTWSWLAHGHALTTLASVDWTRALELIRWQGSFEGVRDDYQKLQAPKLVKKLAGRYRAGRETLEVTAKLSIRLGAKTHPVKALHCITAEDAEHRVCLVYGDDPEPRAFRAEDGAQGVQWVEGRIPKRLSGYLTFEATKDGRTFLRAR